MHDPGLKRTTNINKTQSCEDTENYIPEIKDEVKDCFTDHYDYSEISNLYINDTNNDQYRSNIYDGRFKVPTLDQLIKKVIEANNNKTLGNPNAKKTGLLIEPHYPVYYNQIFQNYAIEEKVLEVLQKNNLNNTKLAEEILPIIIQSYSNETCLYFYKTGLPIVQKLDYKMHYDYQSVFTYASGLSVPLDMIW